MRSLMLCAFVASLVMAMPSEGEAQLSDAQLRQQVGYAIARTENMVDEANQAIARLQTIMSALTARIDATSPEPDPDAAPAPAGVGLERLEAMASDFTTTDALTFEDLAGLTQLGWGQFDGDLDGSRTAGLPIDFRADESTPSGDGAYGRFVYEGLRDGWTGRYLWKGVGTTRLAIGCVMRANFPSNRVDSRSWMKGIGFPATTSNTGWAGMSPPGVGTLDEHRTEDQRTQVDLYQITLPAGTAYPNVNLDLVAPAAHGEWYSFEMAVDLTTGEAKAWWNGTLYLDATLAPGGTFDRVKIPMITLGGGAGINLGPDDHIDIDACVVYHN